MLLPRNMFVGHISSKQDSFAHENMRRKSPLTTSSEAYFGPQWILVQRKAAVVISLADGLILVFIHLTFPFSVITFPHHTMFRSYPFALYLSLKELTAEHHVS